MAEIEDRYEDNVVGKYFVDEQCIDCDLCRQEASANFQRNEDAGYSYVYKQPKTNKRSRMPKSFRGVPCRGYWGFWK